MQKTTLTHPTDLGPVGALITWPFGAVGRLLKRLSQINHIRRDTAALLHLDDHLLKDLGLNRGDIPFVVRNGSRPDR